MSCAVPAERQMEAKFKAWLQRCHTTLDKSVRFESLADSRTQAAVRAKLGEGTTAFERIADGVRVVCKGNMVRVNAKPMVIGRVLHFTVPQLAKDEGCYANGRLHVELLPPEVFGPACEKTFSLRRLEAILTEAEAEEHIAGQLKKVGRTRVASSYTAAAAAAAAATALCSSCSQQLTSVHPIGTILLP